jgi:type II secretory pathway component PulF
MFTNTLLAASIATVAAWQLLALLAGRPCVDEVTPESIEGHRRARLRRESLAYWLLGGLVRGLARMLRGPASGTVARIHRALKRSGPTNAWHPDEWLAARILEAGMLAGLLFVLGVRVVGFAAAPKWLAAFVGITYVGVALRILKRRAECRLLRIRARLPFFIEGVGLMMEAGAVFRDAVALAARTCGPHPTAEEIDRVLSQMERGMPLGDALGELGRRLQDPMVDEFTMTAAYCVDKGNSVSKGFLAMAARMRNRRAHEIEAAAGRAQVELYYPGFLLLMVSMAVVVAPFLAPMSHILQGVVAR